MEILAIKQKVTVAFVADGYIEVETGRIDAAVAAAGVSITLDIDVVAVQIRPRFYLGKK